MNHDQALLELMCRAPACPEWYQPDFSEYLPFKPTDEEYARQRLIQWPKAYARMVLESK